MTEYERDGDGNVTNPPTIKEYEDRVNAAATAGDATEMQRVHDEYAKARDEKIRADEGTDEDEDTEASDDDPTTVSSDEPGGSNVEGNGPDIPGPGTSPVGDAREGRQA